MLSFRLYNSLFAKAIPCRSIQRRNELDQQMLEKTKKAAEENGDQE